MKRLRWLGPGTFGGRQPGDSFEASDELAARWLRDLPGRLVEVTDSGAEGGEAGPREPVTPPKSAVPGAMAASGQGGVSTGTSSAPPAPAASPRRGRPPKARG